MPFHIRYGEQGEGLRSCFDLFEMFFEVKKSSSSSRFFSQIVPLSSLEEAVEPEVFHSQIFKQTNKSKQLLKVTRIGAKRPKGFGETFPRAPQGLSRSDWGWIVIDGD